MATRETAAFPLHRLTTAVGAVAARNLGAQVDVADAEVFAVAKVLASVSRVRESLLLTGLPDPIYIFVRQPFFTSEILIRTYVQKDPECGREVSRSGNSQDFLVPSYCGIYGNEMVDSVARAILENPPCRETCSSSS